MDRATPVVPGVRYSPMGLAVHVPPGTMGTLGTITSWQ